MALDEFAREHFAAIDSQDYEEIGTRLAADCEFFAPGFEAKGSDAVLGFMKPFLDAFPDIRHEVVGTVESGDEVAVELRITGTHTEPLAGGPQILPPTGRQMDLAAANLWRVADGRITSYHVYFDTATLMAQLGVTGR